MRKVLSFLAGLFIAGFMWRFFRFNRGPLFTGDDVMNTYFVWATPLGDLVTSNLFFWPQFTRPFAGLFYLAFYSAFGLKPRPLYWFVWILLLVNLALAWRLFRRLGATAESATIAVLVFAVHGKFHDLSYNAGTLYDSLCLTLVVLAFTLYLGVRRSARIFPPLTLTLFCALLIAALNSKEMAITLVAALALWELLFQFPLRRPASWPRWLVREGRGVLAAGVISAAFFITTRVIPGPLDGMAAYTPVFTWARFTETTTQYLALAFYRDQPIPLYAAALIYAAGLAIPLLLRSRFLLFCFLWFPLFLLPLSFVPPRFSGYVLYLPLLLWPLYLAELAVLLRDHLLRLARISPTPYWAQVALFVVAAGLMLRANRDHWVAPLDWTPEDRSLRQFRSLVRCSEKPRILLADDPFDVDTYGAQFTVWLMCNDKSLTVHRVRQKEAAPPTPLPKYDLILSYLDDVYFKLDNSDTARAIEVQLRPGQTFENSVKLTEGVGKYYLVKDILFPAAGGHWTAAEPEVRVNVGGSGTRKLTVRLGIVGLTISQNGPKSLVFFVNGHEVGRATYPTEGEKTFTADIPPEWLVPDFSNRVRIRVENPYVSPTDQAVLGFILYEVSLTPP